MSKFSFIVSTFTDGLLIAHACGTSAVAIYALTQKLASINSTLLNKVGSAIMPGVSAVISSNDTVRLQAIVIRMTRYLTRFGFLSLVLIVTLNARFVACWVGPNMYGGVLLTILFAYSTFRGGLVRNLATILYSAGRVRGWGLLSLLEGVINVGLTLLWLPKFGIVGAALATVAAEIILTFYAPMQVARIAHLALRTFFWKGICIPLLFSLPMVGVLAALNHWLPLQWKWSAMAAITLGGLMANTLVFEWPIWRSRRWRPL